jgi:hypothetical protein
MPKQTAREASSEAPLTGIVEVFGERPTIPVNSRAATVADLRITFSGGGKSAPVKAKITVKLNTRVATAGTAQLIDESHSRTQLATKSDNAYIFDNVQIPAPGLSSAARVFRITNVRANASGLPVGSAVAGTIIASASTPIRLADAEQSLAVVKLG